MVLSDVTRRQWTGLEKADIIDRWNNGFSTQEIGDRYGVSAKRINSLIASWRLQGLSIRSRAKRRVLPPITKGQGDQPVEDEPFTITSGGRLSTLLYKRGEHSKSLESPPTDLSEREQTVEALRTRDEVELLVKKIDEVMTELHQLTDAVALLRLAALGIEWEHGRS